MPVINKHGYNAKKKDNNNPVIKNRKELSLPISSPVVSSGGQFTFEIRDQFGDITVVNNPVSFSICIVNPVYDIPAAPKVVELNQKSYMDTKELLTTDDLVIILGVCKKTINRMRDRGDLKFLKINTGQIRYRSEELKKYLKKHEVKQKKEVIDADE